MVRFGNNDNREGPLPLKQSGFGIESKRRSAEKASRKRRTAQIAQIRPQTARGNGTSTTSDGTVPATQRQPARKRATLQRSQPFKSLRQAVMGGIKRKQMKTTVNPELAAWGRRVKKRDGNRCQWPVGCQTGDGRTDPHHIAPRARRPDLRLVDANGITLCRTHHDWVGNNPMEAERMGLNNFDSYELAQKIKQGYVVPGDKKDKRVTL